MSDSDDIQNIHGRYKFTLISPASFYVSLIFSVVTASIISALTIFIYLESGEIIFTLPAVIAVLLAIQYFDSHNAMGGKISQEDSQDMILKELKRFQVPMKLQLN